ncbi:MAG: efflux RND transporter periplasmic adaptor subunit [Gammaproteobacteria bacterium]
MMTVLRSFAVMATLASALLALQLAGCGKSESQPSEGGGASPPQQVTVLELQPQDLPVQFEYVGRLEASREIEIRPQITGLIEQRLFEEGGRVDAGQSLFRIDAAPFAARKQAAEAALAEARTRLVQAERDVKRLAPLANKQTVSQRELDDAVSNRDLNRAAVAVADAELTQATLELGYTNVTAPISGHIGRALQVEGALVSPTSGALARLAQIDPLYVNFSIAENDRLTIDRQLADGSLVMSPPDQTRVEVRLADGTPYPLAGQVDFNDYRTDPQTGAFSVRATLPNPDAKLSPGQFVRVRIEGAILPGALAVPQRAVQEDASGKFVYVAGQGENGMTVAQPKPVEVGQWVEKSGTKGVERLWVIRSGLTRGDQVVTDGTARIFFPGMPIMPQPAGTTPPAQDATTQTIDNEAP